MFSFNSFLYFSCSALYIHFLVFRQKQKSCYFFLICSISFFSFPWKLLHICLNSTPFIICCNSFSKSNSFSKPDNPPVYINSCSNHRPTVIKRLKSISKRLFDSSSNEKKFEIAKPAYRDALIKSRFQEKYKIRQHKIKMMKMVINNESAK